MDALIIALIVAVIGPVILAWLTGRQRAAEKRQGWARQDALAEKAAATDALIRDANAKLNTIQDGQTVIHGLVNSNLTNVLRAQYDGLQRELAGLMREIRLNKRLGIEPTFDDLGLLESTRKAIETLAALLADRTKPPLPPGNIGPATPGAP